MNNADLIVATLKVAGVKHGFGVPSGNVLPLMEAMRAGGIGFVLTAHEGSAGFAADVTARMTGKPGLCIATLGPGATNLTTGVGNAYLDRSPLIAITCNLPQAQLGRRIQMWIDHHQLFKPITKASFRLEPGKVGATVAEALRIALSEPVGPVHLDLPEDVALMEATEPVPARLTPMPLPSAPEETIQRAAQLIRDAKHPIAVIGTIAMRMRVPRELRAFIERQLPEGSERFVSGRVDRYGETAQMVHPDYIVTPEQRADLPGLETVYGLTAGLSGKILNKLVRQAVAAVPELPEWQDPAWLASKGWPSFHDSVTGLPTAADGRPRYGDR